MPARCLKTLLAVCLVAAVLPGAPPAAAEQSSSSTYRVAVASVAAGDLHTCVVLRTGAVRCWGEGGSGQLGYGSPDDLGGTPGTTPTNNGDVPLGGRAVAVAAGSAHTCALLTTGAVRCWGDGSDGRLGYGDSAPVGATPATTPALVGDVPLGGRAVAIAAGANHTCALLTTGAVRCWGYGMNGRLGYGNTDSLGLTGETTPDRNGDVPLGGRAVAIAAGHLHTCAVLTTGDVRCWGSGASGQLGYGSTAAVGISSDTTPAEVGDVPLGGRATAIDVGEAHTCAVLTSGGVRCWGTGGQGRLGYGNTDNLGHTPATTPKRNGDVPLGAKAVAVALDGYRTCAVTAAGGLRCWGFGEVGQLGYGTRDHVGDTPGTTPATTGDVPVGGRVVATTLGYYHACAVLQSGGLRCWGQNRTGQLGYGDTATRGDTPETTPARVGDVAVGGPVRTRAATTLRLGVGKARDRRAPYTWKVRGRVTGAFVVDAAACTGKVRVVVKRGKRTLTRRTVALRPDCRYRAAVRVGKAKIRNGRKVRLRLTAVLPSTTNLAGDRATRKIFAR